MKISIRPTLLALGFCLVLHNLPRAEALNCYSSADDMNQKESCGMQTGCIKKFYTKTQKVIERGCFLIDEERCFVEEETGLGVCYCKTDLCNSSPPLSQLGLLLPLASSLLYLIIK